MIIARNIKNETREPGRWSRPTPARKRMKIPNDASWINSINPSGNAGRLRYQWFMTLWLRCAHFWASGWHWLHVSCWTRQASSLSRPSDTFHSHTSRVVRYKAFLWVSRCNRQPHAKLTLCYMKAHFIPEERCTRVPCSWSISFHCWQTLRYVVPTLMDHVQQSLVWMSRISSHFTHLEHNLSLNSGLKRTSAWSDLKFKTSTALNWGSNYVPTQSAALALGHSLPYVEVTTLQLLCLVLLLCMSLSTTETDVMPEIYLSMATACVIVWIKSVWHRYMTRWYSCVTFWITMPCHAMFLDVCVCYCSSTMLIFLIFKMQACKFYMVFSGCLLTTNFSPLYSSPISVWICSSHDSVQDLKILFCSPKSESSSIKVLKYSRLLSKQETAWLVNTCPRWAMMLESSSDNEWQDVSL